MRTFLDLALVITTQSFCIILGFSMIGKPLKGYVKQYAKFAIFVFLCTFVLTYLKYYSQIFQPILVLIDYCCFVIILKLVFKRNYPRIFIEVVAYAVIYACIELFSVGILHLIFGFAIDDFNRLNGFIELSFLEFSLFLVIYRFLPLRNYIERYERTLVKYLLFGINFFIIFLISMSVIKGLRSNSNLFYLYYFLFFSALLTTSLTIRVFHGPREEIVLSEQYLEFEKSLEPVLDELHTIQYDFKHHLRTLNELSAAVEVPRTLEDTEISLRLSNKVIEAIIYCKFQEAKAKSIDLTCKIPDEEIGFPLKNYEYTTIIANLLDNAFEAVEKIEEAGTDKAEETNRIVVLELGKRKQQSYIEVRNTGSIPDETIPNLFKRSFSTKQQKVGRKRGLGLYNVKKIVDQYKGTIEVGNRLDQVAFKVSFTSLE